jgi:hypothetical protein
MKITGNGDGTFTFARADGSQTLMTMDASGNTLFPSGTTGYGTGSGGVVTQITSRTTGVTLNKPSGQITMFTAAGSATPAVFTVTNSVVSANDVVILSIKSGATNSYVTQVQSVGAGSFVIQFHAQTGTASDTPVITFAVIKAASS